MMNLHQSLFINIDVTFNFKETQIQWWASQPKSSAKYIIYS